MAMSIDVLPISAFALETCVQPLAVHSLGQTLTLPIRRARNAAADAIEGTLSLQATSPAPAGTLHAGIVPADGLPLTITL
jgi:hypothetical protein